MKLFPSTTVTWTDETDAPPKVEGGVLEGAHVTYAGNRVTIRANDTVGRKAVVDTLVEVEWRSAGATATATGISLYYVNMVGIPREDAEVSVAIAVEKAGCLTC